MKMDKKSIFNVLTSVVILLALVALVSFASKFSNGFNEDIKTFYLVHDEKEIVVAESKFSYSAGSTQRFDCKYLVEPKDNSYSVNITSDISKKTAFTYSVDGADYTFEDVDLDSYFNLTVKGSYFNFTIPENFTMENMLSYLHPGATEILIKDDIDLSKYYFTATVSNYNKSIEYYVYFNIDMTIPVSFTVDNKNIYSSKVVYGETIVPPAAPLKDGYVFSGWKDINGNLVNLDSYKIIKPETFSALYNEARVFFYFSSVLNSDNSSGDDSSGGITPYDTSTLPEIENVYAIFSHSSVYVSRTNPTCTVSFEISDGYEYSDYRVVPGKSIADASPYSATDNCFTVTKNENVFSITFNENYFMTSHSENTVIVYVVETDSTGTDTGSGGVDEF